MSNYAEDEYLDLLHHILEKGEHRKNERTGVAYTLYIHVYKSL